MIDNVAAELGCQHALGERHADRICQPLAERPGRRLDAGRVTALGMAGGAAAELPEMLDLVERHVGIAGQVEQPVKQHRTVPVRQYKAVAVRPVGGVRVKSQVFCKQHCGDVGHPHRHAGMPGVGFFDGVHRQCPQCVGHVTEFRVPGRGERSRGGGSAGHPGKIVTAPAGAKLSTPGQLWLGSEGIAGFVNGIDVRRVEEVRLADSWRNGVEVHLNPALATSISRTCSAASKAMGSSATT